MSTPKPPPSLTGAVVFLYLVLGFGLLCSAARALGEHIEHDAQQDTALAKANQQLGQRNLSFIPYTRPCNP